MDRNISTYIHEKGTVVNTKGHKLLKFVSIEDGYAEIMESAQSSSDIDMNLGDFMAGLQSSHKLSYGKEEYVLTPGGFQELLKDHLKAPASIFSHKRVKEATKVMILNDLVSGEKAQAPIVLRTSKAPDGRYQVDGISNARFEYFDNKSLATTILNLKNQGMLPDSAEFMTLGIAPRAVDMRIISPEWDFTLGENGHSQRFMGNMVVNNNLKGTGVKVAVTRWECLNSTLGSSVFDLQHKYADYNEYLEVIGQSVTLIKRYSEEMMGQMDEFRSIESNSPIALFDKIGKDLKIPSFVMKAVKAYWQDQGQDNTVYGITQAFVAGVQQVTAVQGSRLPNWGERARIEGQVWNMALHLRELHQDGPGIDHYLVCDKCHQHLPEPQEVVMN